MADFDSAPTPQKDDEPTVASWIAKEDGRTRKEDAIDQSQGWDWILTTAASIVFSAFAVAAWRILR
ncbi:hypothetical protein D3C72_1365060 [compost metagenome]